MDTTDEIKDEMTKNEINISFVLSKCIRHSYEHSEMYAHEILLFAHKKSQ